MKAIICTKYGSPDVLQLKEVTKPTPKDNEVLIRICATPVTTGDCELRRFAFPMWIWLPLRIVFGMLKPRNPIPGLYLSGEIEAVGKAVKHLKEGDQIFGTSGIGMGAHAEYICLPEQGSITIKPVNMTHEEAASVPLGLDALHFLRKGEVRQGQKVLINGAGGSIGTVGVQLAKHFGANVTAVDSAEKLDMLRAIGADHVIDYTREDFTQNGETYDVILDVIGKSSFFPSIQSLKKNGRYLLANPRLLPMIRGLWTSMTSDKKVIFEFADVKMEDLTFLRELIEAGKIKSVIDRCYPLEQIAEAHRYVETGQKKGNVLITMRS